MLLTFVLLSTNTIALQAAKNSTTCEDDIDPLVDLQVTITIKEIRAFDRIDLFNDPDFYVKLFVNDEEFTSEVWHNQKYVKEEWQKTVDVPDDEEYVNITIQLWDKGLILDKICDIARNDNDNTNRYDITVHYSLKTGHWSGDDSLTLPDSWYIDYSGYGRANGCDDNSIYDRDRDCELVFDISQNDYDGDGIPYWTEVNIFDTDPKVDDTGRDDDCDGIPIEWEYKWGYFLDWEHNHTTEEYTFEHKWRYHPFISDDHENIDPDADSINNLEEYLTSNWGSDPFRKDIFVELDQMNGTDTIADSLLPNGSKDLMIDAFNRQNIVLHIDDGSWGNESGSDMIPFDNEDEKTNRSEINDIYYNYFLHGDEDNWRKGVFHYGLVLYSTEGPAGYAFRNNAFQISSKGMENKSTQLFTGNRDIVYASAYMHELGHTLGLNWLMGHAQKGYGPQYLLWWQTRVYKSIMNYGYMYGFIWNLIDYSDGSRGKNDFDDWSNIAYDSFEK